MQQPESEKPVKERSNKHTQKAWQILVSYLSPPPSSTTPSNPCTKHDVSLPNKNTMFRPQAGFPADLMK